MPQDDTQPGEPIDVLVLFRPKKFIPKMFFWGGNRHEVRDINLVWKERKGRELLYFFSVSDENNSLFKLMFNSQSLRWRLLLEEE